jgi:hypothetical protein
MNKNCIICNKDLISSNQKIKYCSEYCKYKGNYKYKKISIKTSNCLNCNTEFTHKRLNAVYCSPICNSKFNYNKEYKKMMRNKDNWKYKSFNLNNKEHAEVVKMYADCSKRYKLKQKEIFKSLIYNLYHYGINNGYTKIPKQDYQQMKEVKK